MDDDRILIYTTDKLYKAEMLQEFLFENEIEVFLINKLDSSYLIGDVEVYSRPEDVMKAKLLIEKFEN